MVSDPNLVCVVGFIKSHVIYYCTIDVYWCKLHISDVQSSLWECIGDRILTSDMAKIEHISGGQPLPFGVKLDSYPNSKRNNFVGAKGKKAPGSVF